MRGKIYLIRHAETTWNRQKKYCGIQDVPLSSRGRRQARLLAQRLKGVRFDQIYCSDRLRALETAQLIFGEKAAFKKVPQLRELCFGVFEGLSHEQNLKKYPRVYKRWLSDPAKTRIPKGESLHVFRRRVVTAMKKIIGRSRNKTVAIVTHGGVISVFTAHILNSGGFWKHLVKSASISVFACGNGKVRLRNFNDTEHLHG